MRSKPSSNNLGESIKLTGVVNLGIGEAIIDDNQTVDSNRDSNSSSDYMSNLDFGKSPTPLWVETQAQKSGGSDDVFNLQDERSDLEDSFERGSSVGSSPSLELKSGISEEMVDSNQENQDCVDEERDEDLDFERDEDD